VTPQYSVTDANGTVIYNPHVNTYDCSCICHHTPPGACFRTLYGGGACDCKPCPDCGLFIGPSSVTLHAATCGPRRAYLHCLATSQEFDPWQWEAVLAAIANAAAAEAEKSRPLLPGEVRCEGCGYPTPDDLKCHICRRELPW
jgi:hypothetical protein